MESCVEIERDKDREEREKRSGEDEENRETGVRHIEKDRGDEGGRRMTGPKDR